MAKKNSRFSPEVITFAKKLKRETRSIVGERMDGLPYSANGDTAQFLTEFETELGNGSTRIGNITLKRLTRLSNLDQNCGNCQFLIATKIIESRS